jgi:hypothetical protein
LVVKHSTGILHLFIAILLLAGCNVTRNLAPNQHLLIANKYKIGSHKISKDDLSGYIQPGQEPNAKLFGLFRANLAFYNAGSKGKPTKFKNWMKNKLGRPPVLIDSSLTALSKKQMGIFLANKGYFHAVIRDSVKIHKKKARVFYVIRLGTPYTIHQISYSIADSQLAAFFFKDTSQSLIRVGHNYDTYLLDNERTRITNALMDHGYYHFSTLYVIYRVDSSNNNHTMNVTIDIRNPVVPSLEHIGTFEEAKHQRYTIGKIFVHPEYSVLQSDTLRSDTLKVTFKSSRHDTIGSTYYFLYKNKLHLKPRTIAQMIFIKSGTWFNLTDVKNTYSQLLSLQLFNYINIQLHEEPTISIQNHDKLDCGILLSRLQLHTFSVSTDGTNSSGALGVQGNVAYANRNLFRGAQLLRISLNGAAQMQGNIGPESTKNLLNTLEFGANASLTFPQFLFPIKPESLAKKFKPLTTISIGYDYQQRPEYFRHISNISFGYSWYQTDKIKHILNPIEISMVKIFPDSAFASSLNSLTDKRIKNQYTNHLVAGLKYTFNYNGQDVNNVKDFFYIRGNWEMGGNLLYGVDELLKTPRTSLGYEIFNIPYSQFVRPDIDLRFYHFFSRLNSFVTRIYAGIGVPYGNSTSLPFEKAFFGGGANDLRGWKMGSLGPGRYHNDTLGNSFDQTGDMQLQLNLEYRFPIYKYFRSAFFMDLGNVWLLRSTSDLPGGKFELKYLVPDIAIDLGIGIRADFDYFIIRVDPAIPVRVPYYNQSNHWYFGNLHLSDITWNFGIGYPF